MTMIVSLDSKIIQVLIWQAQNVKEIKIYYKKYTLHQHDNHFS